MSDGHLYLSSSGVSYTSNTHRTWYDATHQSVLLLSSSSSSSSLLKLLPLDSSLYPATSTTSWLENILPLYDFNEPEISTMNQEVVRQRNLTPIMLLQVSVDKQFLAIQRSDIEVQVLHRATRASYWVLCRSKAGNRILHRGVIWNRHSTKSSSSQDLFLVTRMGLEQYRVSSKRRNCVLNKIIGLYIHEFWYEASNGVLLISSGSRANEIVSFLLHGPNVETLPKLVFSTSVGKHDLHLVTLYGDVYAIYSDTSSTKLLLYLVGRTKVTCVRSLNLMLPLRTALEYSVVDNLLVCHSLDFNVSLFFDIKCDASSSDPFSAPLPISLWPPNCPPSERKTASAAKSVDTIKKVTSDVLTIVSDNDQEAFDDAILSSPRLPCTIRHALSMDDQDLHSSCDEYALVPSPSFESSPASQLASRRSARRLQRAMSEASVEKTNTTKANAVVPSFFRWQFHASNFVQRSCSVNGLEQVEIRKLQLNLAEVCKTCARHREILPFLLRREDQESAMVLVLKLVRNHIVEQQSSLSAIVQLLTTVQTMHGNQRHDANAAGVESLSDSLFVHSNNSTSLDQRTDKYSLRARPTARNAKGFMLIQQSDFYHHVWKSILEDTNLSANYNLSVYIIEYIKNLQESKVQVENITYIALAECFLAAGKPNELYQFLHYHVLADSVELAELMVRNGKIYPALMQVGLDMYCRLKENGPLIHTLLDLGQVERAIEIASKNMDSISCGASVFPGVAFFDSLVKSVTSSKQPRSSFQVAQTLANLLFFLRVWDPAALERSSITSLSTLASHASVPFPDEMIPPHSRLQLKEAFGFIP